MRCSALTCAGPLHYVKQLTRKSTRLLASLDPVTICDIFHGRSLYEHTCCQNIERKRQRKSRQRKSQAISHRAICAKLAIVLCGYSLDEGFLNGVQQIPNQRKQEKCK
jgi:hypothetical protein